MEAPWTGQVGDGMDEICDLSDTIEQHLRCWDPDRVIFMPLLCSGGELPTGSPLAQRCPFMQPQCQQPVTDLDGLSANGLGNPQYSREPSAHERRKQKFDEIVTSRLPPIEEDLDDTIWDIDKGKDGLKEAEPPATLTVKAKIVSKKPEAEECNDSSSLYEDRSSPDFERSGLFLSCAERFLQSRETEEDNASWTHDEGDSSSLYPASSSIISPELESLFGDQESEEHDEEDQGLYYYFPNLEPEAGCCWLWDMIKSAWNRIRGRTVTLDA
ncbi:hypothetical protein JX265_000562 [Neoarthrinium moseri]|uniref:Uncharacterized protein n=1 Tax=Neoarthrinium moseri TaxID=1658444 RepID=A0A9P9WZ16_9PEZI|nr:hypothetical protein JX265_000562 [Neoarthrinium moseri]